MDPIRGLCPPSTDELTVTLNGDVVLETGDETRHRHLSLPPGAVRDGTNRLLVAARGAFGSAARATIVELPPPATTTCATRADVRRLSRQMQASTRLLMRALQEATQMESRTAARALQEDMHNENREFSLPDVEDEVL